MSCKPAQPPRVTKYSLLKPPSRWNLGETHRDYAGLLLRDEAIARERYLRQGVATPDLATAKDFIRFHAHTSRGKIADKSTVDSVNKPEASCEL
jgi:hypothetical protein